MFHVTNTNFFSPIPLIFFSQFSTHFLAAFNTVLNIPCLATTALQNPAVQIGTLSGGTSYKRLRTTPGEILRGTIALNCTSCFEEKLDRRERTQANRR